MQSRVKSHETILRFPTNESETIRSHSDVLKEGLESYERFRDPFFRSNDTHPLNGLYRICGRAMSNFTAKIRQSPKMFERVLKFAHYIQNCQFNPGIERTWDTAGYAHFNLDLWPCTDDPFFTCSEKRIWIAAADPVAMFNSKAFPEEENTEPTRLCHIHKHALIYKQPSLVRQIVVGIIDDNLPPMNAGNFGVIDLWKEGRLWQQCGTPSHFGVITVELNCGWCGKPAPNGFWDHFWTCSRTCR